MKREALVRYLDSYLKIAESDDVSNNGLQVEGDAEVHKIAFAVDVCQAAVDAAVAVGAQMLIVHHGLFWGQPLFLVGPHRRRVKTLLDAGCSLYAVHLPLDAHPEVGNNIGLARLLGLTVVGSFGDVGVTAEADPRLPFADLVERVELSIGVVPEVQACGQDEVQRVAIMSGRVPREIAGAALAGCDTLVTGEPLHDAFHDPAEYGINVIFAGHYGSEQVGLKALARRLEAEFAVETAFIDLPTGR